MLNGLHEKNLFSDKYPFRFLVNTQDNFNYPLHWHNAVEFIYNIENESRVEVSGKEYILEEKDILIVAGGEIHGFNSSRGKRIIIQFELQQLDFFGDMNPVKRFLSCTRIIKPSENAITHLQLEEQILKISGECTEKKAAYQLFLNARILDILVILSRDLLSKADSVETENKAKKMNGLEKLDRVFMFIENNYEKDISLKEAAGEAGFSEYHFSRLFKEITGRNFHSYLNEYRIKKVEKLLLNDQYTIAYIAHMAGFNSISTFNRAFRETKGCSPSDYKKIQVY
ncbi:MAG: AraC family transcriptional regulator [Bacillota bacterium]|nr:AraC family transcriptional regulator [Bacillota bacterium]